jgi:8-hydroxy-5-deazaflavin:NADPH oxidoreductase
MSDKPTLAILGGTGAEGSGLAFRWAHAGYPVIVGSRSAEKAQDGAAALNKLLGKDLVRGMDNVSAAKEAQIVIVTVPYSAQKPTISDVAGALEGKILVDVTVPLVPPKVNRVQLPEGGSAVETIQKMLGSGVRVVSAFQNVSAHHLKDLTHEVECDVLVTGDDIPARETVIELANAAGLRGIHAGPLCNSVVAEALTSVLITINQRYKIPGAGIRITGLPEQG